MSDADVRDAKQLTRHLKVLVGVSSLLDVVTDLGTVTWLLQLAERNAELVGFHARRVLVHLDDDGKEGT
ncbi:hypothetical protein [Streptomyces lydicus]|uniref:hypothetical protein n=1 Tax=Streptomyces lydicus TaxID=47763 RepID=UPI0013E913EF|nr:hypothetical protein [Streptomyces lydicus]MCZ1009434.1 hypothetical protein [Streptomyces lydicus]